MRVRARSFLYLCLRIFFRRFLTTLLIRLLPLIHCRPSRPEFSASTISASHLRAQQNDPLRSTPIQTTRAPVVPRGSCESPRPVDQGPVHAVTGPMQVTFRVPGAGNEGRELTPMPVGEDVRPRPGGGELTDGSGGGRCIFQPSRGLKSSSFCFFPRGNRYETRCRNSIRGPGYLHPPSPAGNNRNPRRNTRWCECLSQASA
jgi:hypothetical protein